MPEVMALSFFEHGSARSRGDRFHCPDHTAEQLSKAGLVRIISANPEAAAGAKSSASPAAPASPKQTVKSSKSGSLKAKKEPSLSPTPASE